MGRTAAPAALKLIGGRSEGRDSGGRVVTPPPAFKRIPPKPPTWLSREAKAEWRRIVPGLSRLELLKEEDRATLSAYCETWATYVEAIREVRETGLTVENVTVYKDGTESRRHVKNPSIVVAESAAMQLRGFAQEFGLTPSAESKLSPVRGSGDDDDENPFA